MVGVMIVGWTFPPATGRVGAAPLGPTKTLDCVVGVTWAIGDCAAMATQKAEHIVFELLVAFVPLFWVPPLTY